MPGDEATDPEPAEVSGMLPTAEWAAAQLPPRPARSHKGTYGRIGVVVGPPGMSGAAALAARGAQRTGAGYVTLLGTEVALAAASPAVVEAVKRPLPAAEDGGLAAGAAAQVARWAGERAIDALVVGPGLGRHPERAAFLQELAQQPHCREAALVLDADAINLLATMTGEERRRFFDRPGAAVVTPHPGEAARLLNRAPAAVQADRPGAVGELAAAVRGTAVLKGARTLVAAAPQGQDRPTWWVNPTGGPALATAGSGDVLSGVIAALVAQGCRPGPAAAVGAFLHGAAGDAAAAEVGSAGVVAGDVARRLPEVQAGLRRLHAAGRPHGLAAGSAPGFRPDRLGRLHAAGQAADPGTGAGGGHR